MNEREDRRKEQIESYLFEKMNKTDKPLAGLTEQMGEKCQQSSSGSGDIASGSMEGERPVRASWKIVCPHVRPSR